MKSAHVDIQGPEHRIVIDMTALEAALFLKDQPVVRREIRRRIRKALSGCGDAPRERLPEP